MKLRSMVLGGSLGLSLLAMGPRSEAALIYGLTEVPNTLLTFNSSSPNDIIMGPFVTGLAQNDHIRGIDFRPATGQLFGLGASSRLYEINPSTGAATQVGTGQFSTLLDGSSFGFDFNPQVDRIRVTSNTGQNLRLHPDLGTVIDSDGNPANGVQPDGTLSYSATDPNAGDVANVTGSAYTRNFNQFLLPIEQRSTTLYNIDSLQDLLVTQVPPNSGTLNTVGSIGLDATDRVGFDITFENNTDVAFAALNHPLQSVSDLYSINLATGQATLLGRIGGGVFITDITAFVPLGGAIPEPASVAVLAVGATLLAGRRRKR